eukprot:5820987-Prymnesium_polylepis.1
MCGECERRERGGGWAWKTVRVRWARDGTTDRMGDRRHLLAAEIVVRKVGVVRVGFGRDGDGVDEA